ncbi:MAG: nuclear transport factor 2 family protein [Minicystis sp.]
MHQSTPSSLKHRVKGLALVAALAGAFVAVGGGIGQAASNAINVEAESQIEKLTYCYARGTDAIGRGDLAGGKSIYTGCFTNDAEVSVYFPGTDTNGPPDFVTTGTDSWADFVESVFTGNGYTATQHHMGNVEVQLSGNQATMSSYLHATHVVDNGTIDVANGTYADEVVKQNGQWKIKRRVLKLITFINLGTPAP